MYLGGHCVGASALSNRQAGRHTAAVLGMGKHRKAGYLPRGQRGLRRDCVVPTQKRARPEHSKDEAGSHLGRGKMREEPRGKGKKGAERGCWAIPVE